MTHRDWFYSALRATLLILLLVVIVNYFNDPLWVSDKENFLNDQQQGFNERQQKTNKIFFTKDKYDSVMVGNSKVTYIDQNHFKKSKLFNYSVSDMRPDEYYDYIEFFKENMGNPKYIILGIDFSSCLKRDTYFQDPEFYFQNTKSPFYQYKQLLSYDTIIYSFRNFLKFFSQKKTVYDRKNVKIKKGFKKEEGSEIDIVNWENEAKKDYELAEYNNNFEANLSKIRSENPKSKIITVFLPDFHPKFLFYIKSKDIYDSCVRDAKRYSDSVYNFMYFNKLTINAANYYDGVHFRADIGKMIMKNIENN